MTKKLDKNRERWHLTKLDDQIVKKLATELGIEFLNAKIMLSRHIGESRPEEIEKFLNPDPALLEIYDGICTPDQVKKMQQRVKQAIETKEKILINGDPDADGISGTVILVAALTHLGAQVEYDFPARGREGHGLQVRIIDDAKANGIGLIITTDCGSKDIESGHYAKKLGIDVIVTDHHILGKELPPGYAIINPHLVQNETPFKALAGAGVAFKVVQAIFDEMKTELPPSLLSFILSVATLGTLSDRMSLLDPLNRLIIKRGAEGLATTNKEGLRALKRICREEGKTIKPRDLSRSIIPRLNAPGRIGDPQLGIPDSNMVVDLMLIGSGKKNKEKASKVAELFNHVLNKDREMKEENKAISAAASVDDVNEQRKYITNKIEEEIDHLIEKQVDSENDRIVIVKGNNWNPGVIGIDTDRLKERFLRPAMIVTAYEGSDFLRGSVRSVPKIDMYHVLERASETFQERNNKALFQIEVESKEGTKLVDAFGGHAQACGFTIHKDDYEPFIALVKEEMSKFSEDAFQFQYEIIDKLPFSQLNPRLIKQLDKLMPYGQRFTYPIFYLQGCLLSKGRAFGNKYQKDNKQHCEFTVIEHVKKETNRPPLKIKGVGFGLWDKFCQMKVNNEDDQLYDVIFTIETEQRRGRRQSRGEEIRLNVSDIRRSGKNVDSFHIPAVVQEQTETDSA